MKISSNAPCPCHSGEKYKKCCQPYHKGIVPSNALKLMRSRYSAYALGLSDYIIRTTHCENPDFTDNIRDWKTSIYEFTQSTRFTELKIIEFIDGENLAYVTFEALLSGHPFKEKSRFIKTEAKWLYVNGAFS